ncbi:MAG: winged helix-turn-helix domain-containing protein [Planctomycetaceae bacterium]
MAPELQPERIESIGGAAGLVWQYLNDNGAVTLSKLAREIDAPRDLVMQGLGWLAREEKIAFQKGPRSKRVTLTDNPG